MRSTSQPRPVQAILHVGDMKCGSTSIQEWMTQDREILSANGFFLSDVTRVVNYDSRLSSYALDDDRLDHEPRKESGILSSLEVPAHRRDIEDRLAAEVAALPGTAKAMIFSHELMLSLRPQEVARLVTMLRRHFTGIRVVAYVRRQDRLFLSLWGQRLKSSAPDPNFFHRLLKGRNYLRMLDTWSNAVGPENLAGRVFDKASFAKTDLQANFREAAGIPPDDRYAPPRRTNESLDAAAQTLLLELGELLGGQAMRNSRRLWSRFCRLFQSKAARRITVPPVPVVLKRFLAHHRTGRGLVPDAQWARGVMAACERDNETIRRRYFPDRPRLFDDDFSDYPQGGAMILEGPWRSIPENFVQPPVGSVAAMDVREAYQLVLGHTPDASAIDRERREAANIAHLYASLLTRSRAA